MKAIWNKGTDAISEDHHQVLEVSLEEVDSVEGQVVVVGLLADFFTCKFE